MGLLLIAIGVVLTIGVDAYRSRKELFCEVIHDWPSVSSSFGYVSSDFGLQIAKQLLDFVAKVETNNSSVVLNIRNTGFVTIEPGDFLTPVDCDFGPGANVTRAEVIGTRPANMNVSVRVEDARKVLIEIDFLSRGDSALVIVERSNRDTDAQVQGRIVGTHLRVSRSPTRSRDIGAYRPSMKYWILLATPILYIISLTLHALTYTGLQRIVEYVTLVLMITFFYLIYRDRRIRGRVVFP